MKRRSVAKLAVLAMLAVSASALAKDKKKVLLPADVLHAGTVLVIVDPTAGVDIADPSANRLARVDVEQALDKWGRFRLVQEGYTADLIIVVRKGNGKIVQPTIAGTPVNGTPPGSIDSSTGPNGSTTRAGGRWGNSGIPNDPSNAGNQPATPYPQIEAGSTQDTFTVYRGNVNDSNWSPLDSPAVWRYAAKNALQSPSVPAVDEFRKTIAESEKQLASTP
jgi:hypothetical protein